MPTHHLLINEDVDRFLRWEYAFHAIFFFHPLSFMRDLMIETNFIVDKLQPVDSLYLPCLNEKPVLAKNIKRLANKATQEVQFLPISG